MGEGLELNFGCASVSGAFGNLREVALFRHSGFRDPIVKIAVLVFSVISFDRSEMNAFNTGGFFGFGSIVAFVAKNHTLIWANELKGFVIQNIGRSDGDLDNHALFHINRVMTFVAEMIFVFTFTTESGLRVCREFFDIEIVELSRALGQSFVALIPKGGFSDNTG